MSRDFGRVRTGLITVSKTKVRRAAPVVAEETNEPLDAMFTSDCTSCPMA